MFIFRLQFYFC